ncbi:MAG: glycosyltransferase [Bdellovibrionales bacterium]|nr:glycosyltransferase [Bdellovibrionales bacterium]
MKVLYVCHIANRYGANRSLIEMLIELIPLGISPHVVVPKQDSLLSDLEDNKIPFSITPIDWWVEPTDSRRSTRQIEEFLSQSPSHELLEIAAKCKPDLVHTNSGVTAEGFHLARHLQLPHIWHLREMGELDYGLSFSYDKAACVEILLSSSACICNSQATQKAYFGDIPPTNCIVLHNPVRPPSPPLNQRRLRRDKIQLLTMGHMSKFKGHHHAISALATLLRRGVHCSLTIVGGGLGEYRDYCVQLSKELKVEHLITFAGDVSEPWSYFQDADIFLHCATNEAFGRVTVEAILARCPVVARASGGTPEIITNRENGFLFNDPDEIPQLIQQVTQTPNLTAITENGYQQAVERFDPAFHAKKVRDLYTSIARHPS